VNRELRPRREVMKIKLEAYIALAHILIHLTSWQFPEITTPVVVASGNCHIPKNKK